MWFNEEDGWYWCDGVITNQKALDLIDKGWSVSCSYNVSNYSDKGGTENNIKYDMEFLDGNFTHLAIVKNPRYEGADIVVVNSALVEEEKEEEIETTNEVIEETKEEPQADNSLTNTIAEALVEVIIDNCVVNNGWITLDRTDENGNPVRVFIEGVYGEAKEEKERKHDIIKSYKEGQETKYDYSRTLAKISDNQKEFLKTTINNILNKFTCNPIAQVEVKSLGGDALGLYTGGKNACVIGLSSQLYSGRYTQKEWNKGVKDGYHPTTDNDDMITNVLTHELGHAISIKNGDENFWKEAEKIYSDYEKNIKKGDIKNPDFISDYARVNREEFVAEAFTQSQLSKNYGKYTKSVQELIDKHFSNTKNLIRNDINNEKSDDFYWIEDFGGGYPINEKAYNEYHKKLKKEEK